MDIVVRKFFPTRLQKNNVFIITSLILLTMYCKGSVALSNSWQFFFNGINKRFGRKELNATEPLLTGRS